MFVSISTKALSLLIEHFFPTSSLSSLLSASSLFSHVLIHPHKRPYFSLCCSFTKTAHFPNARCWIKGIHLEVFLLSEEGFVIIRMPYRYKNSVYCVLIVIVLISTVALHYSISLLGIKRLLFCNIFLLFCCWIIQPVQQWSNTLFCHKNHRCHQYRKKKVRFFWLFCYLGYT